MYSIQTSKSASFDIYLSDDMNEAEKHETLNRQFRCFYPNSDIEIEQRQYGFFVTIHLNSYSCLFFTVVKQ